MGELRVVDELDPGRVRLDQEQRRQALGAVDGVGHHDQHAGHVAGGHEPLLAVDPPAAVGARRRWWRSRRDPSRPRPRSRRRRRRPRRAARGRRSARSAPACPPAARCRRSGTCQCRPLVTRPNCSLTRNHSTIDQPWPPCSAGTRPPCSRAAIAARLISATVVSAAARRRAPRPRPRAASGPARRTRERAPAAPAGRRSARCGRGGDRRAHGSPVAGVSSVSQGRGRARRRAPASCRRAAIAAGQRRAGPGQREQQVVVVGDHRRRRASGRGRRQGRGRGRRAIDQLDHLVQVGQPRRWLPCSTSRSIRARSRATASVGAPAAAGQRRHRLRELALGLGRDRQPGRTLDHGRRLTATDHKVRIEENGHPPPLSPPHTVAARAPPAPRSSPACTPTRRCWRPSRS